MKPVGFGERDAGRIARTVQAHEQETSRQPLRRRRNDYMPAGQLCYVVQLAEDLEPCADNTPSTTPPTVSRDTPSALAWILQRDSADDDTLNYVAGTSGNKQITVYNATYQRRLAKPDHDTKIDDPIKVVKDVYGDYYYVAEEDEILGDNLGGAMTEIFSWGYLDWDNDGPINPTTDPDEFKTSQPRLGVGGTGSDGTNDFDPFAIYKTIPGSSAIYQPVTASGITQALVNVLDRRRRFCHPDVSNDATRFVSSETGSAEILHMAASGTGEQWCYIRIGNTPHQYGIGGFFIAEDLSGANHILEITSTDLYAYMTETNMRPFWVSGAGVGNDGEITVETNCFVRVSLSTYFKLNSTGLSTLSGLSGDFQEDCRVEMYKVSGGTQIIETVLWLPFLAKSATAGDYHLIGGAGPQMTAHNSRIVQLATGTYKFRANTGVTDGGSLAETDFNFGFERSYFTMELVRPHVV